MYCLFRKVKWGTLFFCALAVAAYAQENFQRFSALPFVAYSEETKLQYGGVFILFFRPLPQSEHVSSMDFLVRGTTRNQYQFQFAPKFWLLGDQLYIPATLSIYKWQFSLFERGSRGSFDPLDEYNSTYAYGKIPLEMSFGIPRNLPLRYGVVMEGEARRNDFKGDVPKNFREGYYLGGGYRLVADKSDNSNWPTQGYYASFEEVFFGGDFSYHTETVDARFYTPLFWETSLALGFCFKQSSGSNVPLGKLAGPDGIKRFRGVESSLWSDTQAMIWQLEFRKTLFWRLAGTIFAEALQSGPYFSEMLRRKVHYSVGFGGRLALNKSERLHARADISLIDGKHLGLTIDLREAF